MELASAIRVVIRTVRRRPAQLLPFYLLTLSVPAIMQVFFFVGIVVFGAYLLSTGRIAAFEAELATVDTDVPDPEQDPEAFVEWVEGLQPLLETVITPTSVLILAVAGIITILGLLLLAATLSAGQFATCFGLLRGENGIVRGIDGFKRHWLHFIGLYALELVIWISVSVIVFGLIFGIAAFSLTLALFVGIFAILFWLGIVLTVRAIFVFAPVAIVVEGSGVIDGVRNSAAFIRAQFANAVIYYVIAIGVLIGWGGVSSTLAAFGMPTIGAVGSVLLVAPALDLLKTVLYGDHRGVISPVAPPEESIVVQLRRGLRHGIEEMLSFARSTPGLHGVATGSLVIGFIMGWVLIEPFAAHLDASIRSRIAGIIPPAFAVEIFGNNWRVAMMIAFSGAAFTLPAIYGLWFNGVALGVLGRLEVEPLVLLAFVVPHGILELPAIIISGALGIYLGIIVWRSWRGHIDRETLANSLERATWIIVGLGVVLAIAALIEGFISPFYFRLFL